MDTYAIPPREYRYRDLTRLTSWLRIVLLVLVAVAALNTLSSLAALAGYPLPKSAAGLAGVPFALVPLVTASLFFVWLYRAAANIHAFGADVTFTPGWAVGWFFVPVIDLWMSFLVVEELWRASADARDWRHHIAPWSVVLWWAVLTLAAIVAILLAMVGGRAAPVLASVIVAAAEIWVGYSFIAISARICAMQEAQAARIGISACS